MREDLDYRPFIFAPKNKNITTTGTRTGSLFEIVSSEITNLTVHQIDVDHNICINANHDKLQELNCYCYCLSYWDTAMLLLQYSFDTATLRL